MDLGCPPGQELVRVRFLKAACYQLNLFEAAANTIQDTSKGAGSKEFYDNKIKNNPEKYKQFLEKCKKPSNDYYHKNKNLTVEI